jgi:RNA polymerase sigma-70 factor (ECF subfamily)
MRWRIPRPILSRSLSFGCSPRRRDRGKGGDGHNGLAGGPVPPLPARMDPPPRPSAPDGLMEAVYGELRALASAHLARERAGHTLQTTALAHEAWLRLVGREALGAGDRDRYLALAAQAIRRILIDHARRKRAAKRDARRVELDLETAPAIGGEPGPDLLALDEALRRLEELHERQARLVELRFFAGLSMDEAARALGVSPRTAALDWSMARAWLHAELSRGDEA